MFEGVDRCGKTTQVQRLVETLKKQNISAEAIRFPSRWRQLRSDAPGLH